ncbi:MAG: alpha/beta fold hydrolase [Lachnospiraceae bacterium]|nr:alpha/beta fold hydrolase [Lachnospiraceae bacterium]
MTESKERGIIGNTGVKAENRKIIFSQRKKGNNIYMKKKALKLSIASIGILECINRYIDSYVVKRESKPNVKYYKWENGNICYTMNGKGQPLLLIHDLNVFSSEKDWSEIVKRLSQKYKVYTIDLPGCGRSDKPAITYTNYFYVQAITDFIKTIIQEKTNVVVSGCSSSFVLMADSLTPNLIDEIYMINPPSFASLNRQPGKYSKGLKTLLGLPVIGRTCYYIATNRTNTEYYLSEKCFFNPFHMKQCHVKAAYQASHDRKGKGKYLLASLEGNYLNVDITKALKSRKGKTVLIIGEKESGSAEISAEYSKIRENLIIYTIKNTKHLPQLEMPEDVCNLIQIDS